MTGLYAHRTKGGFVDGQWTGPGGEAFEVRSPSDTRHCVGVFYERVDETDRTVAAARRAYERQRSRQLPERIAWMRAFQDALRDRRETLERAVVSETGKTIAEARTEVKAVLDKFDVMIELAPEALADDVARGVDGWTRIVPLGVVAVIGPYNFPLHLSNGHIVSALLAGNAVVLKPSPVAPACAELYVEAWAEAATGTGADPASLSMLQGAGHAGAMLAEHEGVDAVAFTGSYAVGVQIRQACAAQTSKLLALEMGGKNAAIVLAPANVARAASDIARAAFGMAGQRCTATSRVVVARSVADQLVEALKAHARDLRIGDPFDAETTMGPVSTPTALVRFSSAQRDLRGLESVVLGGEADGPAPGYWVSPSIHWVVKRSDAALRWKEEIFGPELLVDVVETVDEAAARVNDSAYGLAASVHGASDAEFDWLVERLEVGLVARERGTAGASARLPFGGVKRSGNHRPAAAWAFRYCTRPVAVML